MSGMVGPFRDKPIGVFVRLVGEIPNRLNEGRSVPGNDADERGHEPGRDFGRMQHGKCWRNVNDLEPLAEALVYLADSHGRPNDGHWLRHDPIPPLKPPSIDASTRRESAGSPA